MMTATRPPCHDLACWHRSDAVAPGLPAWENHDMTDQLSPMEAIMWRVGQDATLRMTVGAL